MTIKYILTNVGFVMTNDLYRSFLYRMKQVLVFYALFIIQLTMLYPVCKVDDES
jgi:hypothetical protein